MPSITSQPTLTKPKSRIRLRLGLTTPHPKPAPVRPPVPVPPVPASLEASTTTRRATTTANPITQPNPAAPDASLNASTNSFSTQQSRADSRDAFIFDHSQTPSSTTTTPSRPAFDVISYTTTSPTSIKHHDQSDDPVLSPVMHHQPSHPNITAATSASDIFSLTDDELAERFTFIKEIGYGNWGSVWSAKPRHARASFLDKVGEEVVRLGKGGSGRTGGKVAIKLVHCERTPITRARVRALWGEMKIIRTLRHEPHPSIIHFDAFIISPSYAMVIMPYLPLLIPLSLPPSRATPYFRQLASAVGYLHERGITHNDIKPANILLTHNDIPVLVDFGFAQKWQVGSRGAFLSSISWGTPEYLDPQRARGMPHDERASDVWALGITMFEIIIGRTPFEDSVDEEFETDEQYLTYYNRTRKGIWLGHWSMPDDLQHLLRSMICPDPAYRCTAMHAYHHRALIPTEASVIITPHFVRSFASLDYEDEPMPAAPIKVAVDDGKSKRRPRRKEKDQPRAATPTALGESIKQHTSVTRPQAEKNGGIGMDRTPSPRKERMVIRKSSEFLLVGRVDKENEDPTPTKVVKPAQPLRVRETVITDMSVRTSASNVVDLPRPISDNSFTIPIRSESKNWTTSFASSGLAADKRASGQSITSTTTVAKTKEEAVLKAMRSLEGLHPDASVERSKVGHDVLSNIRRPAPEPPRPIRLDLARQSEVENTGRNIGERRSLGLGKIVEIDIALPEKEGKIAPILLEREVGLGSVQNINRMLNAATEPSPGRPRPAIRPTVGLAEGRPFPGTDSGPLAELRDKILSNDQEKLVRFRQLSGDLMASKVSTAPSRIGKTSLPPLQVTEPAVPRIHKTRSVEAVALDGRLDKISLWVRDVERIVDDACKALAEGRETPLPTLIVPVETANKWGSQEVRNSLKNKATAIPDHLRTSSTQVEPATPPKWMTLAEPEETVQEVNEWVENNGKVDEKEDRPTSSLATKLFGANERETLPRVGMPDPLVGLAKTPVLRTIPSTPALRSSLRDSRLFARKSESNLRNSKLLQPPPITSPRRAAYEDRIVNEPGVIRQGEGWSSRSSGKPMAKPSSMASLRERAMAFLRDDTGPRPATTGRNIVDLAAEARKHRPGTPGAGPTQYTGKAEGNKMKGFIGRLRGMVGGKGKAVDST